MTYSPSEAAIEAALKGYSAYTNEEWPFDGDEGGLNEIRKAMRAALIAAHKIDAGWQTIENAPDDGATILVFGGRFETPTTQLADGSYWRANIGKIAAIPTRWMPFPLPPSE